MIGLRAVFLIACLFPLVLSICGPDCTFRFCASNDVMFMRRVGTLMTVRPPGISQGAFICHPDIPNLARVRTVGETLVFNEDNTTVPISQWRPTGLDVPFAPDFFGVKRVVFQPNRWGLARGNSSGNQQAILHDRCLAMPIRSWYVTKQDGSLEKMTSDGSKGDCISFETQTVKVYVELAYDSGDIIEIEMEEPDGTMINSENESSGRGRLSDNANQNCTAQPAGFKNVVYRYPRVEAILPGSYKVTLKHTRNCGKGPTTWTVKVWLDDEMIFRRRGMSDASNGEIIFQGSYNLDINS
ncbi:unnamed protein product [Chondrus crispus]|uniref:Uncharacterized protein n=1 Tax=Chondrus crispus TaxID=2769 RepID=R7Q4Q8_CHOCR|nr:unnamed protein product [Chondrus crispus]CDF32858.1 unnamed protein product [Chondrus crispus]|eukprot:XP_005712659.1 unnamed protein product [Chondrus crispus]